MTKVFGKCNDHGDSWENEYIGIRAAILDTVEFLADNSGHKNIDLKLDIGKDGIVNPEKLVMAAGPYEMTVVLLS